MIIKITDEIIDYVTKSNMWNIIPSPKTEFNVINNLIIERTALEATLCDVMAISMCCHITDKATKW